MRRLFGKLIVFLIIVLITNLGIMTLIHLRSADSYYAAILDKEARLESLCPPRIILVGGSGVAFGMNSDQIEAELEMPVVNMGLQGGLGLRFMLDQVRNELQVGDVVVIIPEYMHFFLDGNGSETLVQALIAVPQSLTTVTNLGQYITILRNILSVYSDAVQHMAEDWINNGCFLCDDLVDRVYQRNAFNLFGDISRGLATGRREISDRSLWNPLLLGANENPLTSDAVQILNEFYRQAIQDGAQVYLSFPAARSVNFNLSESRIQELYQFLQTELQIPMINTPEDNVLSVELFFDTFYHVNDRGRDLRTSMLIEDLQDAFQNP